MEKIKKGLNPKALIVAISIVLLCTIDSYSYSDVLRVPTRGETQQRMGDLVDRTGPEKGTVEENAASGLKNGTKTREDISGVLRIITQHLHRYIFSDEKERLLTLKKLTLYKSGGYNFDTLVTNSGISIDSEKFLYRGMRLTLEGLENILKKGLEPHLSYDGEICFATSPADFVKWAFGGQTAYNLRYISNDFLAVIVQVDKRKEIKKNNRGPNEYSSKELIPPDWIRAIYVFNKEIMMFKDITGAGREELGPKLDAGRLRNKL